MFDGLRILGHGRVKANVGMPPNKMTQKHYLIVN